MALRETAYLRPGEVFPASNLEEEDCSHTTAADQDSGTCPHRAGTCDGHGCCSPADRPPLAVPPSGKKVVGEHGSVSAKGGENGPDEASAAQCGPGHHPDAACRWPEQQGVSLDTVSQPGDAASGTVCPGSEGTAGTDDGSTAARPPGSKLLEYIRRWSVKRCARVCALRGSKWCCSVVGACVLLLVRSGCPLLDVVWTYSRMHPAGRIATPAIWYRTAELAFAYPHLASQ